MLFQSAVVIAEAAKYLFGFVTSGRVGHSNVEPVFSLVCCTEQVLGSGNLGSGYLGVLTISGNFVVLQTRCPI